MPEDFKPGDRIRLVFTADPLTKLRPGDSGTVSFITSDSLNGRTVHVKWDSGSTLSMLLDHGDQIELIHP